jgi:hypothetical protein
VRGGRGGGARRPAVAVTARAAVVWASLLVTAPAVTAQTGSPRPYQDLAQRADLVIVGECQSAADTGERRSHPESNVALPVQEWRATFRASAVLKAARATAIGSIVPVRYLRFDYGRWRKLNPGAGLANAGMYVFLEPRQAYLLFLKEGPNGAYEPASGQLFPNDSVYLLDRMSAVRN